MRPNRLATTAIPLSPPHRELIFSSPRTATANAPMSGHGLDAQTFDATPHGQAGGVEARLIWVGDQKLMVAMKYGVSSRPLLLVFNGIGANWQLAEPFLDALTDTTAIVFDLPGVGGSPLPTLPYRPSGIARLSARLVADLGYDQVDVAGVSWGGGTAQQFAHQYPGICRRLVLAATSPGAIMVPGRLGAVLKTATPRRYWDKDYMRRSAPDIYGGAFKRGPFIDWPPRRRDWGARFGVFVSAPGNGWLEQSPLAVDIAAANPHSDGPGRSLGPHRERPHFSASHPRRPGLRSLMTDIYSW
jgi:pimeloyl-ACP methyl ester carboxylesterase